MKKQIIMKEKRVFFIIITFLIICCIASCSKAKDYSGKWEVIDRMRFVEGSINSIEQNQDGTAILNINTVCNYHSETDPSDSPDFPFLIGEETAFILKRMPEFTINTGDTVVLYESGMTAPNHSERFTGAVIMYLKTDNGYIDSEGQITDMPPTDYSGVEIFF